MIPGATPIRRYRCRVGSGSAGDLSDLVASEAVGVFVGAARVAADPPWSFQSKPVRSYLPEPLARSSSERRSFTATTKQSDLQAEPQTRLHYSEARKKQKPRLDASQDDVLPGIEGNGGDARFREDSSSDVILELHSNMLPIHCFSFTNIDAKRANSASSVGGDVDSSS